MNIVQVFSQRDHLLLKVPAPTNDPARLEAALASARQACPLHRALVVVLETGEVRYLAAQGAASRPGDLPPEALAWISMILHRHQLRPAPRWTLWGEEVHVLAPSFLVEDLVADWSGA